MPSCSPAQHSRQCIRAARSSRLHPHALHPREQAQLYSLVFPAGPSEARLRTYLAIRNAVLRLWTQNPFVCVSRDEALQCAKDKHHQHLAAAAFEWLTRNGYINFGCVDIPIHESVRLLASTRRRTVVVVGAGVSGLSTARQLHGLCAQVTARWIKAKKEPIPHIIVLEARNRIGGRVYSHPVRPTQAINGGSVRRTNPTAEIGAQIITGFEHGNPLDAIIRGQLALEYHSLKDNMIIFDSNNKIIEHERDAKAQAIYNELISLTSVHGWKTLKKRFKNGKSMPHAAKSPLEKKHQHKKVNGDSFQAYTLGALMDHYVMQWQEERDLDPLDLRLLNWHYANLEYANAVNVNQLSLGGWDQDDGNEFKGSHSQVMGGYSQVTRALMEYPQPLDVRIGKRVSKIRYTEEQAGDQGPAMVECDDGEQFQADQVVVTLPLGVLQERQIAFEPPLPSWKEDAFDRLGFGVLNKVILVFDEVFWDVHRDMFGLLNEPKVPGSLNQDDYQQNRGIFFLIWNCVKASGVPMLVLLMAGDAAVMAEHLPEAVLINLALARLMNMFELPKKPVPREAIVTKWRKDKFACGTYSYLGPNAQPHDYDIMAQPVGNLHFAGEATCGTHPATVHGAYLSGLRAASEVFENFVGPVEQPQP